MKLKSFSDDQETSQYLMPDESTMWGGRFNPLNSLAACPNNTSEFALLAHCVSTPFTHKPLSSFSEDQGSVWDRPLGFHCLSFIPDVHLFKSFLPFDSSENICSEDEASIRRQTKRLRYLFCFSLMSGARHPAFP